MRKIGVNKTHLLKIVDGDVVEAIQFVDDYRPSLSDGIDRRYVVIQKMPGCIWYSDRKDFSTKEEGNDFYNQLKSEGYVVGTEAQYDAFVRKAANLTY